MMAGLALQCHAPELYKGGCGSFSYHSMVLPMRMGEHKLQQLIIVHQDSN